MTFLPAESITVGLYALALSIITVLVVVGSVPGGLGTISGSRFGLGIIITASAFAVLQAVDGIALKLAADSWVAAPPREKAIAFRVAKGIRFIEYGTNSIFRILQGTVTVIFGVAIVKSKLLSKWIGGAGVVIGAVTIYAGLEVSYLIWVLAV